MRVFRTVATMVLAAALLWWFVPERDPVPDPWRVTPQDGDTLVADVVVIGSSSGGVAAAIAAAREGADVLLVSDVDRVGGMVTNGVTTDLFDRNLSSGLLEEWRQEVVDAYRWAGIDPSRYRHGLYAPPDISLEAVERLLYDEPVRLLPLGGWITPMPRWRRSSTRIFDP